MYTPLELSTELQIVTDEINSLKSALGLNNDDARIIFCNNTVHIINSYRAIFNVYDALNKGFISENHLFDSMGRPSNGIQGVINDQGYTFRVGLIVAFMFQVENLLANIYKHIEIQDENGNPRIDAEGNAIRFIRGYENLAKEVRQELGGDDNVRKDLMVLALIRNSFHGNGCHGNKSFDHSISSMHFSFVKGETVNHGNWQEIFVLMKAIINVLSKLLMSERIKEDQEPIMDQYSWDKLTTP